MKVKSETIILFHLKLHFREDRISKYVKYIVSGCHKIFILLHCNLGNHTYNIKTLDLISNGINNL